MDFQTLPTDDLLGPLNEVERKHAPPRLFVAGDTGILSEGGRVAIVGSRKASADGLARARRLAKLLVERGVVVVSGLAEGVDTAAHTAAIAAGGRTIAVLGTPLDRVYPRQNAALQDEIMQQHLCVSQFVPGSAVSKGSFPLRNRTMALISDATVIIEATDQSGSLHQGWEALRLGRGLYIAKSLADDPGLAWPAKMLHYGATILSDETLGELFEALPSRTPATSDGPVPF